MCHRGFSRKDFRLLFLIDLDKWSIGLFLLYINIHWMNGSSVMLDKQQEIMLLKGKGFLFSLNHLLDY